MSITPLPSGLHPAPRGPTRPLHRHLGEDRRPARLASTQRRWLVTLAKRVLPLFALALLLLVAFWPEIQGTGDRNRISYRRIDITPEGGQLTDAHYQGVDDNGRPYTVTATRVRQRRHPAQWIPPGGLDLPHGRTEVGEDPRQKRPGQVARQIEDDDAGQRREGHGHLVQDAAALASPTRRGHFPSTGGQPCAHAPRQGTPGSSAIG